MFVSNISISIVLIPKWGSLGAAIGTSASYLLIQGLYIFDQYKYLNLPSTKPTLLFFVAYIYGVAQIISGGEFFVRLVVAVVTMVGLFLIAKKWKTCEGEIIAGLLPRQFAWVGRFFD
jgi:O-antigen/teichoic acid export membrane protein